MKLEQLVCSLELAKKLQEFGVKQESLFYWYHPEKDGLCGEYKISHGWPGTENSLDIIYSAFTADELGEMLLLKKERPKPMPELKC